MEVIVLSILILAVVLYMHVNTLQDQVDDLNRQVDQLQKDMAGHKQLEISTFNPNIIHMGTTTGTWTKMFESTQYDDN